MSTHQYNHSTLIYFDNTGKGFSMGKGMSKKYVTILRNKNYILYYATFVHSYIHALHSIQCILFY